MGTDFFFLGPSAMLGASVSGALCVALAPCFKEMQWDCGSSEQWG